jgi:hypothetical protein
MVSGSSGSQSDLVTSDRALNRTLLQNRTGTAMNTSIRVQSPAGKNVPIWFQTEQSSQGNVSYTCGDGYGFKQQRVYSLASTGLYNYDSCFTLTNISTQGLTGLKIWQYSYGAVDTVSDSIEGKNIYMFMNNVLSIGNASNAVATTWSSSNVMNIFSATIPAQYDSQYISEYGHNGNQILIRNGASVILGAKDSVTGAGTDGGYWIYYDAPGWNQVACDNGGVLKAYGALFGGSIGNGNGGIDASCVLDLVDTTFDSSSRFRRFSTATGNMTRVALRNWGRLENYVNGGTLQDLVISNLVADKPMYFEISGGRVSRGPPQRHRHLLQASRWGFGGRCP